MTSTHRPAQLPSLTEESLNWTLQFLKGKTGIKDELKSYEMVLKVHAKEMSIVLMGQRYKEL